ncbi:MAG: DUF938 domain-containing protein [Proteobacteria bacterium]|nr:DUF938 domain-containing protein [Pseudomonadota bacterium]
MTDSPPPPGAWTSPSTARNRQPILEVLRPRLAPAARVLEVASGAGEHAVYLAGRLPGVAAWQPSDPDPGALASIAAWRGQAGLPNLAPPIRLDAADPAAWPAGPFEAVVCINMVHISPWAATLGLMAGAAQALAPGGRLFLYGPYLEAEVTTALSNLEFDKSLKTRDPAWGLRDLAAVKAAAAAQGLAFVERIAMPANNLVVIFEKAGVGTGASPPS